MTRAVDFDGTLCRNEWPSIGAPNLALIHKLITRRLAGDKLILWTCREGERLQEALMWCQGHGLTFDAVNDGIVLTDGVNTRKVWADVYIDDKAIRPEEMV